MNSDEAMYEAQPNIPAYNLAKMSETVLKILRRQRNITS